MLLTTYIGSTQLDSLVNEIATFTYCIIDVDRLSTLKLTMLSLAIYSIKEKKLKDKKRQNFR